jgi:putative membrane protein
MKNTLKLAALAIAVSLAACNDSSTTSSTTKTDSVADTKPAMTASPDQNTMMQDSSNKTGNQGMANAGMTDQDFVTKASAANIAEINAHKAAGTHAMSADVKMHAKHMLTDHMKLGDDMKALATKKGLTLSTDPPADKKKMLDDLNTKKGKDWDMGYLDAQVQDHNEAIALFEQGSTSVKDADLKALIDKTLPTLRSHLQMVQEAQAKVAK